MLMEGFKLPLFHTRCRPSPEGQMALLAPASLDIRAEFPASVVNGTLHKELLHKMQSLRGQVYLRDGAITETDVTSDGRHALEIDDYSWHLLTVAAGGRVTGCMRYTEYPAGTPFERLHIRHCALAYSDVWRRKLINAVGAETREAEARKRAYVEVGGWALAQERRSTSDALRLALGGFALGQLLGGCLGVTTATVRNNSSTILRRLGGRSFEDTGVELPRYYDPQYGCEMELLRFDSDRVNSRFANFLAEIKAGLMMQFPVVSAAAQSDPSEKLQDFAVWQPHRRRNAIGIAEAGRGARPHFAWS
jgi:hypothetical protein